MGQDRQKSTKIWKKMKNLKKMKNEKQKKWSIFLQNWPKKMAKNGPQW